MTLFNQKWIGFGGEPLTGKTPTQTLVYAEPGVQLSAQQEAGVAHAYNLFCDAVSVSAIPGGYHVQHRQQPDGTKTTMTSIAGVHQVKVWPVGGGDGPAPKLASLFFALPGYTGSVGYPPYDPKFSAAWKFRGKTAAPTTMKPMRGHEDARGIRQHPGNLTWWSDSAKANGKPMILSWYGRATRYGRMDYYGRHWQFCLGSAEFERLYGGVNSLGRTNWKDAFKPAVWLNGVKHDVYRMVGDAAVSVAVMSCGLKKTDDGLQLYLVSYDGERLAVYSGTIKPYTAKAVKVTKRFDIGFTVDATTYPAAHPSNPMWETLLQPIYFNGACTAAAGLVAVQNDSLVNPDAAAPIAAATPWSIASSWYDPNLFGAVLLQLDIAAGTTAFTCSHVSNTAVVTQTHTGAPVIDPAHPHDYSAPTEEADRTSTRHIISYGAVDYAGEQLLLCLVDYSIATRQLDAGASGTTGDHVGSFARTTTQSCTTGYRAYLQHNNATLAQKTTGSIDMGTLHIQSSQTYVEYDPTVYYVTGSCTGYRTENVSAPIYWAATVEGGDLRHDAVVMAEFLEIGDSQYEVQIKPGDVAQMGWAPDLRTYSTIVTGLGQSTGPTYMLVASTTTDHLRRKPAARFSVWSGGAEIETGPALDDGSTLGGKSAFGLLNIGVLLFPSGGSAGSYLWWTDLALDHTEADIGYDWLRPANLMWGTTSLLSQSNPLVSVGRPYVNTSAFSTDGRYFFYDLGPYFGRTDLVSLPYGELMHPVSAFVIDGVRHAMDMALIIPGAGDRAFSSPVFLDNVPLGD